MSATSETAENKTKLEKARLDWCTTRTQLISGLILIAMLSALHWSTFIKGSFSPDELPYVALILRLSERPTLIFRECGTLSATPLPPVSALTLLMDKVVWQSNALGFHVTNLLIYLSCTLLVALIALEVTGRSGNRIGAAPAIWAALLFSIYPQNADLISSVAARGYALTCLLSLLAIFAVSRLILLRERAYLWLALASLCFLAANGLSFAPNPIEFESNPLRLVGRYQALFFPRTSGQSQSAFEIILPVAYALLAFAALCRTPYRLGRLGPLLFLFACLFLITLFPSDSQVSLPTEFYASVPLCLIITFLAFPSSDSSSLAVSRAMSLIGLIALAGIALAFWLGIGKPLF